MVATVEKQTRRGGLAGRTLYIPQMAYAGARLVAAVFRAYGIDARPAPDSDAQTLELGGRCASGEECLPHKVTLGDLLKVCEATDFDPAKTAFFMPTAHGPCRFGQYSPYLQKVLAEKGWGEALVISPTSRDGYAALGIPGTAVMRSAWMAVVAGDLAMRFLLKTRPYETHRGDSDAVFEETVADYAGVLEQQGRKPAKLLGALVSAVERMRDRFRDVPARYEQGRPLIGLVGEIFCRLNTFSNNDAARRIESFGGECWISDIAEWVWYVHRYQQFQVHRLRGRTNLASLGLAIKTHVQRKAEHALLAPVMADLRGYEEPHDVREILELARPYLPFEGSLGEMVLSVGKAIYLYGKGADGIIDISPFTCMNGIICEAIYPSVSAACAHLPIRVMYFDGIGANIDRDVEIFLDLARAYQRRKQTRREYPDYFRKT